MKILTTHDPKDLKEQLADEEQQLVDHDERYMCTCHGIDRVGDACIENCGKVRL